MAWTIIRFELHHLWNPDWTYAFPQTNQLDYAYAYADGAYYDDDEEYEYRPEDYNTGVVNQEVTDNEEATVEETEHEEEDNDENENCLCYVYYISKTRFPYYFSHFCFGYKEQQESECTCCKVSL